MVHCTCVPRHTHGFPYYMALTGFTATVAQLLLVRELTAVFYGNELLMGILLASWLVWVAVGALLGTQAAESPGKSRVVTSALAAVLLPAQMALIRYLPALLAPAPGVQVGLGRAAGVTLALLMPLCLTLGWQFALYAQTLGRATYLYESLGGVVGGVLFSLGLVRWLNPFQIAFVVGALNLIAGVLPSLHRRLGFPTFILLALMALPLGREVHQATLRAQYASDPATTLAYTTDSPYGRLIILARGEQYILYENGVLSAETQSVHPEEVVHLALLAHPHPDRVLLIGGTVTGNAREVLRHPVSSVTAVELDAQLIEAAQQALPPDFTSVLDDPRVTLVLDDGRRYLQRAETASLSDIVLLDVPPPSTGALNRFYTLAFFETVAERLTQQGIFVFGLPSSESYWSQVLARRNASVYHTLRRVFPHVVVLPGEWDTYLASHDRLTIDVATWQARLAQRDLDSDWVTASYLAYVLADDRLAQTRSNLEALTDVRLNRDTVPTCYYYDLALWASRFNPRLQAWLERLATVSLWWLLVPLGLLVISARRFPTLAPPLIVGSAGASSMVLNVLLLLGFQAQHGTLYQNVGLLVAAFMGGHALGLWAGNRWGRDRKRALRWGLVGNVLNSLTLAWLFTLTLPAFVFVLLAMLCGALTGVVYPLTLPRASSETPRRARVLYAADLAGGCVGALAGGTLLVPLMGLPQSCLLVAAVLLAHCFLAK